MKNIDVELIHRVLDGDDNAFETLVKKYRKPVHALVWRKIGDFHIAEEITQDTFLKAYQGLSTLKKPQRFAGWLYVIAANQCSSWLRKKRLRMQSLEETDSTQLEKATYSQYVIEENERTTTESKREVVKQLLAKLQESERTVITLHYFGDMSAAEIGAFLGVSVNTIKSRLRRAQQRLKKEEPMVRAALEHFQITPNLTDNIMREVSRMKPVTPSGSKPLVPVPLSAATAVLIFLIMGMGSQYLARFQKPYNIDAQSEMTVEIIDASIVLDTQAKSDLRDQVGRFDTIGKSSSTGPQLSEPVTLGAARIEKKFLPSTQQWIQASGPEGGSISGLLASSTGDVYAASSVGIYRLSPDARAWTLVNTTIPTTDPTNSKRYNLMPMAERDGTLYLVSTREVFVSLDRGETWMSLGVRPKGAVVALVITDEALYLGLRDGDVFRSTDSGQRWTLLTDETSDRKIFALTAIENIVFVGTNQGLYRLSSGTWEKVSVGTTKSIHSLAVSGDDLYIGTGPDLYEFAKVDPKAMGQMLGQMLMSDKGVWEIFHSTDLGDSWTEITPVGKSVAKIVSPGIKVMAAGDTVLALGIGGFRSTDRGHSWKEIAFGGNSATFSLFPSVTVNENTFFKVGPLGAIRSIDGGTSWHPFMTGIVGTRIIDLVGFKNRLYANTGTTVAKSIDGGESWEPVLVKSEVLALEPLEKRDRTSQLYFPKLTIAADMFYVIAPEKNELHIFRISANGNTLIPIEGMPVLGESPPSNAQDAELQKAYEAVMADDDANNSEKTDKLSGFFNSLFESLQKEKEEEVVAGGFAVSRDTFYLEYKRRLFKWKSGDPAWVNTGLIDAGEQPDDEFDRGFKVAVSGDTVYVGKRDGHLFRSLDGGDTWRDLTSNLPLRFTRFNEIVFAGLTVYIATDAGVLASQTGEDWRAITDKVGTHIVIDRLAVAGTEVYGTDDTGVYRLNSRNRWEKISPEVPDSVINLVINRNKLYIATEQRGIFHVSIQEKNN